MVATLSRLKPAEVPRLDAVHVDASVLIFTYAVVALTTLLTAVVPALQSTRPEALRARGDAPTLKLKPMEGRAQRQQPFFQQASLTTCG